MRKFILRCLLVIGVTLGSVGVVTASPASASVGTSFSYSTYFSGGHFSVFAQGHTGTAHPGFRAWGYCEGPYIAGRYLGVWQTQPGPYYGSTATCPINTSLIQYGVQFT